MGSPERKWVRGKDGLKEMARRGRKRDRLSCLNLLNSQTITSFGMKEVSVRIVTLRIGDGLENGLDRP